MSIGSMPMMMMGETTTIATAPTQARAAGQVARTLKTNLWPKTRSETLKASALKGDSVSYSKFDPSKTIYGDTALLSVRPKANLQPNSD